MNQARTLFLLRFRIVTISKIIASIENAFPTAKLMSPKINPIPEINKMKLRAHFFLANNAAAIVA